MKKITYCLILVILIFSCEAKNTSESKANNDVGTEKHIELYENGAVKIKGDLVKGIRQGKWEAFYENGVKWSESNYLFGKRNGIYKIYYPNGRVKIFGVYENEKKVDVWFFYRENGELEKEIDYNKEN